MARKKEEVKTRLVELNNKSRKGLYVYVKKGKKKGSYYKFRENSTIDAYIAFYERRNKKERINQYIDEYKVREKRRKKRTPISRKTDRYLRKVKKKGTISEAIQGGIASINITNPLTITPNLLRRQKEKLLEGLVIDKEILRLITEQQNFDKLKHRLEYRITLTGKDGEKITGSRFNESPEKVVNQLQKMLKIGQEFGETQQLDKMKRDGWKVDGIGKTFKLDKVSMMVIFRKQTKVYLTPKKY